MTVEFPVEDMVRSSASRRVSKLCSAIIEDTENARRFSYRQRGALELHSVVPFMPTEICHRAAPLASELTSLID